MTDRDTFESWPKKKRQNYAKRMYPIVREEVLQAFRDAGKHRDKTGKVRDITHHCWEKGMGGAIPLWYYFQYENLLPWSDDMHKTYHDKPKKFWTKDHHAEAKEAEKKKQAMIEDNERYHSEKTKGVKVYSSVAEIIKSLDE